MRLLNRMWACVCVWSMHGELSAVVQMVFVCFSDGAAGVSFTHFLHVYHIVHLKYLQIFPCTDDNPATYPLQLQIHSYIWYFMSKSSLKLGHLILYWYHPHISAEHQLAQPTDQLRGVWRGQMSGSSEAVMVHEGISAQWLWHSEWKHSSVIQLLPQRVTVSSCFLSLTFVFINAVHKISEIVYISFIFMCDCAAWPHDDVTVTS